MIKAKSFGSIWRWLGLCLVITSMLVLTACTASFGSQNLGENPPAIGQYAQPIEGLAPAELEAGDRLKVVATTTLVADLAAKVGGDAIELTSLLPYGADPHGYSATPQDLRKVSEADVVLSVGFDLESALLADLTNGAPGIPIVSLSQGIDPLAFSQNGFEGDDHEHQDEAEGDDHTEAGVDPHVWFDPINMERWAVNSARVFALLDPSHQSGYQSRQEQLMLELAELDRWIQGQVDQVPPSNRELVTDHLALTYFANRYGFEVVGAVIPAYSSTAEVSAQELARLQELITSRQVRALFVGATANPDLTERVGADLGIPVVRLYTGSLTPPSGEAGSYDDFMRYNVNAIVDALDGP